MFVRVTEINITTITIKADTKTVVKLSINDDVFTYRFNFRRRPVLVYIYIGNYDSNFTINSRIKFYKAAFSQRGNGFHIPVFKVTSRNQYGKGFHNVRCGIVQFILRVAQFLKPVAMKGFQTLIKACSKAIKTSATVNAVIKYTLKPLIGAVIIAPVYQIV